MPNKRRLLLSLTIVMLLAMAVVGVAQASVYNGTVVFSCINADAAGTGSHVLDRDNTGAGEERFQVLIFDGAGTVIFELTYQNVLGTFSGGIGDFFYTTPPAYNPLTFQLWSLAGNSLPLQLDYEATGECAGLPTYEEPVPVEEPVPGCDVLIPIPSTAVGAKITADTLAYWTPGQATTTTLKAGTSVRAISQDAGWYKILFACDFLYVPVGTIGPNPESPWFGAPLP